MSMKSARKLLRPHPQGALASAGCVCIGVVTACRGHYVHRGVSWSHGEHPTLAQNRQNGVNILADFHWNFVMIELPPLARCDSMRRPLNGTSGITMTCVLAIGSESNAANILGTRYSAIDFRERIERQLESCPSVELNFAGVFVTQSFVDELLGPLILRMGASALGRLAFSGCSEEAKAILRLVIAARLRDHSARQELRAAVLVNRVHYPQPESS